MDTRAINNELGNADLFLIDQILKNRFTKHMKILDVGCGEGRNLVYFIRNGYDVYGVDSDEPAILMARFIAGTLNKSFNKENLIAGDLHDNIFVDEHFDAVISINVLHFSNGHDDFFKTFSKLIDVLKPKGILFLCMESSFCKTPGKEINGGLTELENGDLRFLLTEDLEEEIKKRFRIEEMENKIDLAINKNKRFSYRTYTKL